MLRLKVGGARAVVRLALVSCLFLTSSAFAAPEDILIQIEKKGRALDARIEVKRLASTGIGQQTWRRVRAILLQHPEWGEDILRFTWDKIGLERKFIDSEEINSELEEADRAMQTKGFEDAEKVFKNFLKKISLKDYGAPFIQLAIARAQYGGRKFRASLETYAKIRPTFTRYRQVLFEQMWAAFRTGDIDIALGAIASQSSGFFSSYLDPEAYLVKIYLFKRLCRDQEAEKTMKEVKQFQSAIKNGRYDFREWAKSEPVTRAMLNIVDSYQSSKERSDSRDLEVASIKAALSKSFEINKARLLEDLESVASFAVLAVTPGLDTGLKAIEKIGDRGDLLEKGLEIWPSDDSEAWADEIGKHRFLGESECGNQPES